MSLLSRIGTSLAIYTAKKVLFSRRYSVPVYCNQTPKKQTPSFYISTEQLQYTFKVSTFSDAVSAAKMFAKKQGGYHTVCKLYTNGAFAGYGLWSERKKCLVSA